MNKTRRTALELVSEELTLRNKARDIYHMKGELARQLGIDMTGFFGMYPNNYQFSLLSNLGGRELALMQIVLRMTYESMCTEWYFTGTQLKEFAKKFTKKINGRHIIAVGNDKTMSALGGIKELHSRGFLIYEQVPNTKGSKTLHKVQITARTITLEGIADMRQLNDGYHFLLGEANYHGLFDEEYSEIGITAYNHLNKAVKDHKKTGVKMPKVHDFCTQKATKHTLYEDKECDRRSFNEPICDESVPSDLHNTKYNTKDTEDSFDSMAKRVLDNDETIDSKQTYRTAFSLLIDSLFSKVKYKSKVKQTEKAFKYYLLIQDKTKIEFNYVIHEVEAKKYAKSLENFLLDYEAIVSDMNQSTTSSNKP